MRARAAASPAQPPRQHSRLASTAASPAQPQSQTTSYKTLTKATAKAPATTSFAPADFCPAWLLPRMAFAPHGLYPAGRRGTSRNGPRLPPRRPVTPPSNYSAVTKPRRLCTSLSRLPPQARPVAPPRQRYVRCAPKQPPRQHRHQAKPQAPKSYRQPTQSPRPAALPVSRFTAQFHHAPYTNP